MELICPDCRGVLQVGARRSAHCPLHGGQYEILFDREVESMMRTAERPAVAEGRTCEAHPRQSAVADCATCGKALCAVCSFDVAGRAYCSDCALGGAQSRPAHVPVPVPVPGFTPPPPPPPVSDPSQAYMPAAAQPPAPVAYEQATLFAPVTPKECPVCRTQNAPTAAYCSGCGRMFDDVAAAAPPPRRSSVPVGLMCAQHLESEAVAQCRACSAGMCVTCDFQLPGGVHVCAECIDKAGDEEVSPRRKRLMAWSLVVVVYTTVMMGLLITGALNRALGAEGGKIVEAIAGYGIFMPAILGTALAFGAFDRRLRNTPMIWTSVIWNSVILGFFLILIIIGLLS